MPYTDHTSRKCSINGMSYREGYYESLVTALLMQPGVASVYCSIVQQTKTGAEFYVEAFPELTGCNFQVCSMPLDITPDARHALLACQF